MAKTADVLFAGVFALLLIYGCMTVYGDICCREHWELGRCIPGVDDSPTNNGKCWNYCIEGCTRGGFCKHWWNGSHVCHCYC
ncbi:hypothetical protein Dimus_025071 [Dionaea muscipula]